MVPFFFIRTLYPRFRATLLRRETAFLIIRVPATLRHTPHRGCTSPRDPFQELFFRRSGLCHRLSSLSVQIPQAYPCQPAPSEFFFEGCPCLRVSCPSRFSPCPIREPTFSFPGMDTWDNTRIQCVYFQIYEQAQLIFPLLLQVALFLPIPATSWRSCFSVVRPFLLWVFLFIAVPHRNHLSLPFCYAFVSYPAFCKRDPFATTLLPFFVT